VVKLQLGAGSNVLSGWLNTDLAPDAYPEHRSQIFLVDAAKPFPLADLSVDYIFSEHQIEHMSLPDAQRMLAESFRVLRPGGRIRLATPDLAAMVRLYDDPIDAAARDYVRWVLETFWPDVRSGNERCYAINHIFMFHSHRFIYDFDTLSATLTDAGFVDVVRWRPGESDDPVLRGVESHGRVIGEDINRFETLVVEARRPSLDAR
jgi:ubiquinone/menaquinone biosynthesis C-methylase UbiE